MVKPPRRTDCPAAVTRTSIKCLLTNRVYRWNEFDTEGRETALDQHAAEAGKIVDANNARAGRRLLLSEHLAIMRNEFDPRTERERVMAEVNRDEIQVRSNAEPNEGSAVERVLSTIDPESRFWKTPERHAALQRMKQDAEHEKQVIAAKEADEARRSDERYKSAVIHADSTLRLLISDDAPAEMIAAAKQNLDNLHGHWTADEYWQAEATVSAAMEEHRRPAQQEQQLQREADAANLAADLQKRKEHTDES